MKAWLGSLAFVLAACSGTQAQQSDAQEPISAPAAAPAAGPAAVNQAIARPDTAPNFTISELQAEEACEKGASKALVNEDKDLMITVALCQKLQQMFPASARLQYALATLYSLHGNPEKAATFHKGACENAKAQSADAAQAAKLCAPLPKAAAAHP